MNKRATEVSVWSVNIRQTDIGWQARFFRYPDEQPIYYHCVELETLLERLRNELPCMPKTFRPLSPRKDDGRDDNGRDYNEGVARTIRRTDHVR